MRTALSTSWCELSGCTCQKLIEGFRHVGATRMELSYNLRSEVAEGLLGELSGFGLKPVSAHHPFPLPDIAISENPSADLFNPVDRLESERRAACELIKESLRRAADAQVDALVVHFGSIPELSGYERELWKNFKADADIEAIVSKGLKRRRKLSAEYLYRALRSLEVILPVAEQTGVRIGLENRYFLMGFPDFEEFKQIFETFDTPFLGYWHDVGHGVVRARFGYEDPEEVASSLRHRLIGMHIHDAVGVNDHRPPGSGEVNFREIFSRFGVPERLVFEPAPGTEIEGLKSGLVYMENLLNSLGTEPSTPT